MRLTLALKANKYVAQKSAYDKYYSAMQGFVYKKLENSEKYKDLHNKKGYKQFCFGNIFPIRNKSVIEGNNYNIIISSPDPELIQTLFFNIEDEEIINLGEFSFLLENKIININKLKNNSIIECITFINITKHEEKIKSIKFEENGYLDLLRKNLLNKFNFFNKTKIDIKFSLFDNVNIKLYEKRKEGSIPIFFRNNQKNDSFKIIGNKLIFEFKNISEQQLKIFQFCFDIGFGERNSYGMGFMAEKRRIFR